MSIKKKDVCFNDADPHQLRILQWVEAQSSNFSGFVKDTLFAVMQGAGLLSAAPAKMPVISHDTSNDAAYMDIL